MSSPPSFFFSLFFLPSQGGAESFPHGPNTFPVPLAAPDLVFLDSAHRVESCLCRFLLFFLFQGKGHAWLFPKVTGGPSISPFFLFFFFPLPLNGGLPKASSLIFFHSPFFSQQEAATLLFSSWRFVQARTAGLQMNSLSSVRARSPHFLPPPLRTEILPAFSVPRPFAFFLLFPIIPKENAAPTRVPFLRARQKTRSL